MKMPARIAPSVPASNLVRLSQDVTRHKGEDVKLFRCLLLTCVVFVSSICACYSAGNSNNSEQPKVAFSIKQLLHSDDFALGMSADQIEEIAASKYALWTRSDRTRKLNNRQNVELLASAKEPYLQTITLIFNDQLLHLERRYDFALTSPLSESRVYSIKYAMKPLGRTDGLMHLADWKDGLISEWGINFAGNLSTPNARAVYFFDDNRQPYTKAASECGRIYPAMFRLDEKSPEQVSEASELLHSLSCRFSRDNIAKVQDDVVWESVTYDIDFQRQIDDVRKRVAF
ncbi:hypothetical protein [Rhizobium leguminosarum]|uniref:hypothetical protein n=1 Tax=Rhizobium leguminosarum TaxID=384 RepID=UPI003D6EDF71